MKKMKRIHLKLGKEWYYFDPYSQRFRQIGNRRTFKAGELLYRDSEFYLVVPRKKLKAISWNYAGKKIYELVNGTSDRHNFNISSKKILFAFQISDEEEVQTCIKRDTVPYASGTYPELDGDLPLAPSPPVPSTDTEKRAKTLLHTIVNSSPRLQIRNNSLYIRSINHKVYRISLASGSVHDIKNNFICVYIYNCKDLPLYDIIIAKALAIAYSPNRICTLT